MCFGFIGHDTQFSVVIPQQQHTETKTMFKNWSWALGRSNPIRKLFGGPQLRQRTDGKKNIPLIIAAGVGIGIYAFQPAIKEAAEIVAKEQEKK